MSLMMLLYFFLLISYSARVAGWAAISYPTESILQFRARSPPPFAVVQQQSRRSSFVLQATVYAPWDDEYSSVFDEEEEDENNRYEEMFGVSSKTASFIDFISKESLAALARLAVAFSQTGGLHLQDIADITVLDLQADHIDLQAVVCETDGCVTLSVPVQFPTPCVESAAFEECILDNLGQLDAQATTVIQERDYLEAHSEETDAKRREKTALSNPVDWTVPEWWIRPCDQQTIDDSLSTPSSTTEMKEECDHIRRLLNEDDFGIEISALATQAMMKYFSESDNDDLGQVDQAAVAAVGPAGIIVRAAVSTIQIFDEQPRRSMMEIPIPFSNAVTNVDELRAAVLGLVAAAGEFAE